MLNLLKNKQSDERNREQTVDKQLEEDGEEVFEPPVATQDGSLYDYLVFSLADITFVQLTCQKQVDVLRSFGFQSVVRLLQTVVSEPDNRGLKETICSVGVSSMQLVIVSFNNFSEERLVLDSELILQNDGVQQDGLQMVELAE